MPFLVKRFKVVLNVIKRFNSHSHPFQMQLRGGVRKKESMFTDCTKHTADMSNVGMLGERIIKSCAEASWAEACKEILKIWNFRIERSIEGNEEDARYERGV